MILKDLMKITLLFYKLESKSLIYFRSTVLFILSLLSSRETNGTAWRLLDTASSVFNEEPGELSLSVLARLCQKDTMKADCAHMSCLYSFQSDLQSLIKDWLVAETTPISKKNRGQRVATTEDEVKKTVACIRTLGEVLWNRHATVWCDSREEWTTELHTRKVDVGLVHLTEKECFSKPLDWETFKSEVNHCWKLVRSSDWVSRMEKEREGKRLSDFISEGTSLSSSDS